MKGPSDYRHSNKFKQKYNEISVLIKIDILLQNNEVTSDSRKFIPWYRI